MAEDLVGVRQISVSVSPKTPEIRKKVLARLEVMQREAHYVQNAILALRSLLAVPQPSSRLVADAVMDSRNWSISVAMSHAYVQSMLSTKFDPADVVALGDLPHFRGSQDDNLPELFLRGVLVAMNGMGSDPDFGDEYAKRNPHRHYDPIRQAPQRRYP